MPSKSTLYQIADELRAIATMGLWHASNGYDEERYRQVMRAAARLVAAVERSDPDTLETAFLTNLYHISPLVGVEVAVFREDRLLLIQRRDDQRWALPGGLVEVGETLAEAAERELEEEAGLCGRAVELLGVFDSRRWQTKTDVQLYTAIFLVEANDDLKARTPIEESGPRAETIAAAFFAEDALPLLSQGHHLRVPFVFRLRRGEVQTPFFDSK